jgi:hypothetical protein
MTFNALKKHYTEIITVYLKYLYYGELQIDVPKYQRRMQIVRGEVDEIRALEVAAEKSLRSHLSKAWGKVHDTVAGHH